jgi:C-terminal processing protease CtpA/Prc
MKAFLILLALLLNVTLSNGQDCNCEKSFDWMVTTFRTNDAGFQYIVDKRGSDDFERFHNQQKIKAQTASTDTECQKVMLDWLHYFRSRHINIVLKSDINSEPAVAKVKKTDEEIRTQFKKEPIVNLTEAKLIALLGKKKDLNPIEGVWSYGKWRYGIIADEKTTNSFTAFIIKADSVYWMPGQIRAQFTSGNEGYATTYKIDNRLKENYQSVFMNTNKTVLNIGDYFWVRRFPHNASLLYDSLYTNFFRPKYPPYIKQLNSKTLYMRIPSFDGSHKKWIEELFSRHESLLKTIPNLIIDIRYGTGGSDRSYRPIIPYLYTNPIRKVLADIYSTELNVKFYEDYLKTVNDSSIITFYKPLIEKLKAQTGKFVPFFEKSFMIDSLPEVFPFPKKVAIICNHRNGSADEQFLITARQSQKVKIFGRPTGGALDISNMNEVESPDGKYMLRYGVSKSNRAPVYCIDGVGIQPDYFLDESLPEGDWIEYVQKILEY